MAALGLGILVGLAAGQPEILVPVAIVIVLMFVTASLRRPDPLVFLGFLFLMMPKLHVPGSPLPVSEIFMLLAVFSAFLTLKKGMYPIPRWTRILLGIFVGSILLSTFVNETFSLDGGKRLLHILVYVLVIIGLIRGLLPRKVAMRGLQIGLVISAVSGVFLLPQSSYVGRVTGLFNDPNVAGLLLVVGGGVALSDIKRRRYQVAFVVALLPALLLTYSRTSLLALLMMGIWLMFGRKLKPIPAFGLVIVGALAIWFLPTSIQKAGPFSDRTGSDQLRDRVASQEIEVVRQSPFVGHGPGSATVMVNFGTTRFFFHNSYLALMQEGGGIALGSFMALSVGALLALMSLDTTDRQPFLEASIIGVWVMSINLGEVILELTSAIAIGFAIAHVVRVRARNEVSPPVPVAAAL